MVRIFKIRSSEFQIVKRIKFAKKLLLSLKKLSGRSNIGRLIFRGRGGGYKRFYRIIDFKRLINAIGKIIRFEYDPNRNIFIMLLLYNNGVLTYNLAPILVKLNTLISNNRSRDENYYINGNLLILSETLTGSFVNSIKINNPVGKYSRAAGTYTIVLRKLGSYILLRFPSKEEIFVYNQNHCILGRLSTANAKLVKNTSAGYYRRLGFKPSVRGVAKNPIDHPHGGGEGRTTSAQPSVSPWGFYTKGSRTTTRFKRYNINKWGFFKRRNNQIW